MTGWLPRTRASLRCRWTASRALFVFVVAWLCAGPSAGQAATQTTAAQEPVAAAGWLPVQTFALDNGVVLHVVRRPLSSWISAGWAVRVGAADDPTGGSGMAHLVEHLLYTGSDAVGTRDWSAERPLLEEEARLVEQLLAGDRPAVRRQLAEVRQRLGRLQMPGDLARRWVAAGVRSEGALTTKDFSLYRASFPAQGLETWMKLEVDRLARPAFRLLAREVDVVLEENLQRVASVPQAPVEERFDRFFWGSSPYARPPDDPDELVRVPRRRLAAFHRQHYRPDNLVVSVVGDVDVEEVLALARRTFGALRPGELGEAPVTTAGLGSAAGGGADGERTSSWSATPAGRRKVDFCDCRPTARIRFATVPYDHDAAVAFDVLAAILNGRSGRLMLGLVNGSSDVFAAYASHKAQSRAGTFSVVAEATHEDTGRSQLEGFVVALRREIGRLADDATVVRPAELQRARNMLLASAAREVKSSEALRSRLLIDDALGDGDRLGRWRERVEAVTSDQVVELVRRYLLPGADGESRGVEFIVLHGEGLTPSGGGP